MAFVSGREVAEQTANEVRFLATSASIPWKRLNEPLPPPGPDFAVWLYESPSLARDELIVRCETSVGMSADRVFESCVANMQDARAWPCCRHVEFVQRFDRFNCVVNVDYAPVCLGPVLAPPQTVFITAMVDPPVYVIAARTVVLDTDPGGPPEDSLTTAAPSGVVITATSGSSCKVVFLEHVLNTSPAYCEVALYSGMEAGPFLNGMFALLREGSAPLSTRLEVAPEELSMQAQATMVTLCPEYGWISVARRRGAVVFTREDDSSMLAASGSFGLMAGMDVVSRFVLEQEGMDVLRGESEVLERFGPGCCVIRKKLTLWDGEVREAVLFWMARREFGGSCAVFFRSVPPSSPYSIATMGGDLLDVLPSGCVFIPSGPGRIVCRLALVFRHCSFSSLAADPHKTGQFADEILSGFHGLLSTGGPAHSCKEETVISNTALWFPPDPGERDCCEFSDVDRTKSKRRAPSTALLPQLITVKPGSLVPGAPQPFLFYISYEGGGKRRNVAADQEGIAMETNNSESSATSSGLFALIGQQLFNRVAAHLSVRDLLTMSAASRMLRILTADPVLWEERRSLLAPAATGNNNVECARDVVFRVEVARSKWKRGQCTSKILDRGHTSSVRALCWLPSLGLLVTGASDRKIKLWESHSSVALNHGAVSSDFVLRETLGGPNAGVVSLDCDGQSLWGGFRNGLVRCWKIGTLNSIELSGDQQVAAVADGFLFLHPKLVEWDDVVQVWDEQKATVVAKFSGHSRKVTCVKNLTAAGENIMLSSSLDKTMRVWDCRTGEAASSSPGGQALVVKGHTAGLTALEPFRDLCVATAANDRTVRLWDMRNPATPTAILSGHVSPVKCLRNHAAHGWLLTGSDDRSVRLWDPITGECLQKLAELDTAVSCLNSDTQLLIAGSSDGQTKVFDFLH